MLHRKRKNYEFLCQLCKNFYGYLLVHDIKHIIQIYYPVGCCQIVRKPTALAPKCYVFLIPSGKTEFICSHPSTLVLEPFSTQQ